MAGKGADLRREWPWLVDAVGEKSSLPPDPDDRVPEYEERIGDGLRMYMVARKEGAKGVL